MIPGTVIRVVGAALVVVGLILLGATGAVASALGAQGGAGAVPGASDPASLAFWFQLSFIRLFGTTLIGLGVVLCGATAISDRPSTDRWRRCWPESLGL